jgi:hypothetical protein
VLKDGGVLLLEEPDTLQMKIERGLTGHSPALDAGFSLKTLREEMRKNGLAVVEQSPLYFGLFGSFLCVKAASSTSAEYVLARHLLKVPSQNGFAAGQEMPA